MIKAYYYWDKKYYLTEKLAEQFKHRKTETKCHSFSYLKFKSLSSDQVSKCGSNHILSESLKILGTFYKNFLVLQLNYPLLTATPAGPKKPTPPSEIVKLGNKL